MKPQLPKKYVLVSAIVLFAIGVNLPGCQENPAAPKNFESSSFVGSESCKGCHENAFADWQNSHHDWAMKLPDENTVLGDFNEVNFNSDGVAYTFLKKDGQFWAEVKDLDGLDTSYKVAFTFGVTPLQQYLIEFPGGKYQVMRASWNVLEKKWFHQYAEQEIAVDDWLHWTRGGQRWNTMCAECHSTNLVKNYDVKSDVFQTTYDEINVGCEACHGPADLHLSWANEKNRKGDAGLVVTAHDQSSQLNACAGCHARRSKLTEVMTPGLPFDDEFILQNITSEFYHGDGQIKEEDYVFGSFVQSKMFHKEVKCSDCHNPHSLALKLDGNALCMQCHEPKYNTSLHHFHAENTASSMCINCHMTGKKYMGNDFRRDHSFRIPRPDQSLQYNAPNACNDCHSDKSTTWASEWVVKWYGKVRPENYSDKLLKLLNDDLSEHDLNDILNFIGNTETPFIARSTLLEYLPITQGNKIMETYIKALRDPSPRVRYQALAGLQDLPFQERISIALKHIEDEFRIVRIGAAKLVVELNIESLEPAERSKLLRAREELEDMLMANADFPLGRLQLGDYNMRQGKTRQAIVHYEKALEMDPLLTPVYSNLATAYNMNGENGKAISTLNKLIVLEENYDRAFYLRSLLHNEMGNESLAIQDMERAIELNASIFQYYYNLSTMQFRSGNIDLAENSIKKGLTLEPENAKGIELLNYIKQHKR